jgi:ribosomal protein S18 acetylase RimI-like enzyme
MFAIVRLEESDRPALRKFWAAHWGEDFMVAHGRIFRPDNLDGFIALDGREWVGLVTFYFEASFCEVLSLDSLRPGTGIGTALIKAAEKAARQAGCHTLKLITTNDNTPALRLYQKLGFELVALRRQAVNESRKVKPSIPEFGLDGIPIRDEIELELRLAHPNPEPCT